MFDERYMSLALKLAHRGQFTTTPNPNVGCLIVRDGNIIGEGWHHRAGGPHAEICALLMAGSRAKGSTVYVTLEPCNHYGYTPPCCDSLIAAGVRRIVVAMQDPNPLVSGRGLRRLQNAGIDVNCGLMMQEAEKLNRGFLKRMRTGLPWIQVKLAISLDGKIAMANGESKWITSQASRSDVQRLRAQSSAILTSSSTVLVDNPSLTVRWEELNINIRHQIDRYQLRQPIRIVIDNQHRLTTKYKLFNQPNDIWLIRSQIIDFRWPEYVSQIIVSQLGKYLNLKEMMCLLGQRQVNNLLVEAGPQLTSALLKIGLVDELIIYLAPKILGHNARNMCILPDLKNLVDAYKLYFSNVYRVDKDLCLTLIPCNH
ncbi:bifunctional diaminohydroxyphosphoribosylaminopyrimidine deaminase/5-amino-6-(5-phosphoribosylamino)uracil reductase RibD [Pantoea sp. Aalb]|uniref:bifunctional diaminohydroxyphosphoribosylaminopyrimidine deaminase/5-amino-6-(5-phosphoribosylamino)uracil reductase RibD n=1 Tax=Pantoea sp. Aalb TaxID=2576762 RepID=UPI0013291BBF|nr:bifunctional diaminohydroxyphosphoribosylaminopyrimidine deaminase/5-amino-6-(5-phosphoribosylamino)uracil reductase RibD [Pantoea sp. Aalb]MXP67588.1 bifunctional diaminohydroxyphosphoribosylaminopyrimidine deaminase/5-amino-6-(5-phosphoribosylamino)uracil reductase RibD [Pantoea sp. Aalb]